MIEIQFEIPENVSKIEERMRAMSQVMRSKTRPDIQKLFRKTIQGWEHVPRFDYIFKDTVSELSVTVYPAGDNAEIYKMVSLGSPAHPISPRRSPFMTLQRYRAATRPGSLRSGSHGRTGPVYKAYRTVLHKGFPARDFPDTIKKEYEPTFRADMESAMDSVR
jgi:hypothetical protein